MGWIAKLLFGISSEETTAVRRGFHDGNPVARERMDRVGRCFVTGYHAALEDPRLNRLIPQLEQMDRDDIGFGYEGAAMGLALQDWLTPWNRSRVAGFLQRTGGAHAYMVHVGAGWALARLPGNVEKFLSRFDPLLRWLIVDGYGFHEGFFHWRRHLAGASAPARLKGYAIRVFDQGLGRCLWFIQGGDIGRVASSIQALAGGRHGDLWSGVGLAAVYAGVVSEEELRFLREAAGSCASQLGQGAAFAAKARQRAGNLSSYQDVACRILCGMPSLEAARVTDETLENLPTDGVEPAYEIWRKRIQERILRSATVRT